jgi:DNA-binding MarR family transcriptional regulator
MLSTALLAQFSNMGQYLHSADSYPVREPLSTMKRDNIDSVLRSLRRVNLQGSFLGQTVAIRFGLSESDIETLEQLIDMGATTAGKLGEITGLTSGAVTRVIDRLEQGGYVRRVPDPTDRRRVIVEVVPEKVAAVQSTLNRVSSAGAEEIARYTDAQLALIGDFLTRMEQVTKTEATTLRATPETAEGGGPATSEHWAPIGGLREARLVIRSGLSQLRLRAGADGGDLYRASFVGATPQVRLRDGRVLVGYRGLPFDWRQRVATFGLNPTIPWTIDIVGGIQRVEADLRALPIQSFDLSGGAERIQLELGLPSGGLVPIKIVGGVKTIRLERPAGVPVRLSVVGGSGEITLDDQQVGQSGGQTTVESRDWTGRGDRYELTVIGGSKSIEVATGG